MKQRLILFYRNPELGKVKTRLAKDVGDERALAIYHALCEHTLRISQSLACDKVVYYSHQIEFGDMWPDTLFEKKMQSGNDLGERMANAIEASFAHGYTSICIIGTDCLELTSEIINQSFTELEISDSVIGPARDGGYYLLGMKRLHPEFFRNKQWSTDTVYQNTIQDFEKKSLSYSILPLLRDVDEVKDLPAQYL
ncbi:MAG: TIGR04282 family arsenosugar biosynthesis glycosyltransferase [Cyclobacteriaceae bacterium]|jgi:rSAM/selenodomain-associated transferase 1|nr:TIGR04282 family arsenosugar biosynthesis glycosyltransferase [Flammeovirgaceae bacterium]